jgi:hypothetical protein
MTQIRQLTVYVGDQRRLDTVMRKLLSRARSGLQVEG